MTLAHYYTFLTPLFALPLASLIENPPWLAAPSPEPNFSAQVARTDAGSLAYSRHVPSLVPARNSNRQTMTLFSLLSAKRLNSMSASCEF